MATIQEVRAKLLAQREKAQAQGTVRNTGDNASYPFWNMNTGSTATVRFLPDADPNNVFPWVAREVIKLPFAGVVGGEYPTTSEVTVTVPCMHMFGEKCPIIDGTRHLWKEEETKALARLYWKKKSYIFQGFVINSPFVEENVPENPIRRFVINPSIFEIIEKSITASDEMEDLPSDYDKGRDFKIAKTQKGDYANYGSSSWSFKTRALGSDERGAIEQYGLFNLADSLGKRPDADGVAAIEAMFKASMAGEPFDFDAFGSFYKPYGPRNAAPAAPVVLPAAAPKPVRDPQLTNSQEIMERLKVRTKVA